MRNREEGELFRFLKAQEEIEQQQAAEQQALRETAILRVMSHIDALIQQYPARALEMAKSCDYQISQLEAKVNRMMEKYHSEERAIQIWERDALSAADAKVRDLLGLPRSSDD